MKSNIILTMAAVAMMATSALTARAQGYDRERVRFHNEATDTVRINEVLAKAGAADLRTPGQRIAFIGRQFIGTPYVGHTLEGDQEWLTVNVDELDCTTFVETVAALAKTVGEGRSSWRDFVYNLEQIRYRGGEMDGYGSRLHYISDWIVDNSYRGNMEDATTMFGAYSFMVKTIDFMSQNRKNYPALADSATFERIKGVEQGLHNHRFPYIRTRNLGSKDVRRQFRNGDMVGLTSNLKNLDVYHMGIIVLGDDGEPYLMHASSSLGKVTVTEVPLAAFMKRNPHLTGIRVFRLK